MQVGVIAAGELATHMASHPYLLALVQIACQQPCGVTHANKHTVNPMPEWQCFVRRYNYHNLVIPIQPNAFASSPPCNLPVPWPCPCPLLWNLDQRTDTQRTQRPCVNPYLNGIAYVYIPTIYIHILGTLRRPLHT